MKNLTPNVQSRNMYESVVEVDNQLQTNNQQKEAIFNTLLQKISKEPPVDWNVIIQLLEAGDGYITESSKKKIFKVGAIKLLVNFARLNNFFLAKNDSKIFVYNGKFWIEVEEDLIKQFLRLASLGLRVPVWIASDVQFINDLYKQLLYDSYFDGFKNTNQTLINLQNGTIRIGLDGVQLQGFDQINFLTHQLNFDYDPNAKNTLWTDFLDTVLPDKLTQKTLQQSLGYLFIQDLKLEKAIFLFGTGSNGKSVIFEVLNGLLSQDMITNYSLESLTGANGYHRANLNNKLINYGTDISMKQINHGIFKQLVSGEPIEVRQIYEKPFIMKRYAKLIFNLNRIDDADVESTIGFFRRMIFIPFEVTIEPHQQDKTLHKKILQNKAGVLNWILEGTKEVLNNQEIFISPACDLFLNNFKKDSNLAIRFKEQYGFKHSNKDKLSFQETYEKFRDFCQGQGEKPWTQKFFNSELKKLGFKSTRTSSGYVWHISAQQKPAFFTASFRKK